MSDTPASNTEQPAASSGMWFALIAIVMGTFVSVLNSSLMNVALNKFVAVFGSSVSTVQWVITGYMLASAMVIPMSGFLGARFGAKNIFVFSVAGFTIGSVLCGLAWSDSSLIFFRIIQGFAGGFIMPVGMTIIYMTFPREKTGAALGLWGVAAMVAPALGPTLGGYLIQHYSWRVLFFINIPIGILAVILGRILLKDSPPVKGLKFDTAGALLSMTFFGSLLLALSKGQSEGWTSLYIISLLFVAVFSLLLLIWVELNVEKPVMDLRLFLNMKFTISVIASSLVMMGMMGGTFLTPVYLQSIQSLSPMQTGLVLLPQSIAMALMMPISGRLFDRFGILPLGITGLTILGATTLELHHLTVDTPNHWLNVLLTVRAIGIGLCMMPLSTAGMNAIPTSQIGNASPLSNVCRQVAGSMGIALLTAIMSNRQTIHYQHISESVSVDSFVASQTISGLTGMVYQWGVDTATASGAAASVLGGVMQLEALARSIADTFFISAIPAILCIPFVFLLAGKKKPADVPAEGAAKPEGPAEDAAPKAISTGETPELVKA
ncbi:DHA2 family efflux MFS transporter permease subunit [Paenibacillus mucilaginosus]|uniref:Putative multidrug resistance protein n=1 Tax=Paenibacillus mucilaginosus (strain KNP414) TaxID=1036673 RepID=F8FEX0_PAEMK|nr:DHA2 family efflux MFS transporter permease subunit [Paenibacillus mucilaginosus]AEI46205.1 putative multidrug resistance protein [Paenibacillus mucilaginosus KNP414]MCG7213665.1 DHA2 family efflux MFS transporter permease subunit [Paenibacillus mucilaginosus]WDM27529.1 DHA2 family efflux MFS transporter permease subunit [Paenibacillus mucilaginosus]